MSSLNDVAGFDVLMLGTGFQRGLLATFQQEATIARYIEGAGFQEAAAPDKQSAAIAVVAHFEYSDSTAEAREWTRAFENFDWTVQDARGANDPAQLKQMQARYGLYCIAPSQLEQKGIFLENIVTYKNKARRCPPPRSLPPPSPPSPTPPLPLLHHLRRLFQPLPLLLSTALATAASLGSKGYVKRDPGGRVCLENCRGVPPSYYFIFTLRPETLLAAKLVWTGDDAPSNPKDLLGWAKAHGRVDQAALVELVRRVVREFTHGYTTHTHVKPKEGGVGAVESGEGTVALPLSDACRLLREVRRTASGRSLAPTPAFSSARTPAFAVA